jgi:hypothetical protein
MWRDFGKDSDYIKNHRVTDFDLDLQNLDIEHAKLATSECCNILYVCCAYLECLTGQIRLQHVALEYIK